MGPGAWEATQDQCYLAKKPFIVVVPNTINIRKYKRALNMVRDNVLGAVGDAK